MAASALVVFVALLKGRSMSDGLLASLAILSPSMMMAYERGNIDLLILALVGSAALRFCRETGATGRRPGVDRLGRGAGTAIQCSVSPLGRASAGVRFCLRLRFLRCR